MAAGIVVTGVYATVIAAFVLGSVFALGWRSNSQRSDHELCWSCRQRNQHKLWCPNR